MIHSSISWCKSWTSRSPWHINHHGSASGNNIWSSSTLKLPSTILSIIEDFIAYGSSWTISDISLQQDGTSTWEWHFFLIDGASSFWVALLEILWHFYLQSGASSSRMSYLENEWCFHIMDGTWTSIMTLLKCRFKNRWLIHAPGRSIPLPGATYPPFRRFVPLSLYPFLCQEIQSFIR